MMIVVEYRINAGEKSYFRLVNEWNEDILESIYQWSLDSGVTIYIHTSHGIVF